MRLLSLLLPRQAFRQTAQLELAKRLPAATAEIIWRETLTRHAARPPLAMRVAPGLALLLRYFEWDCALYRAARNQGLSEADAGALIEEINWALVGPPVGLGHALTRLASSRPARRVRWLLDALFGLLFTAPFRRQVLSSDGLAFDVQVCPLADFFRQQGLPELTRYAACGLDYRMAHAWKMRLLRRETLAEGASRCDFRFEVIVESPAGKPRDRSR